MIAEHREPSVLCASFRPTLRANLFAEGSGAMTIYEEGLSLLSCSPELYDFLPAHPEKLCMPIMQT